MSTPDKSKARLKISARLSERIIAILNEYQRTHEFKDRSEALEKIIEENPRLHWYIRYLGDIRQLGKEPPCDVRIFYGGEYYCSKNPPRVTKLLCLDVCKVCPIKHEKPRRAESPVILQPEQRNMQIPPIPDIKNPAIKHADMIYCGNGGMWVFPRKCQTCTIKCRNYQTFINEST